MIKKAIIPIAGYGTRFLPLSKILAKEFWPLVDIPVIQYIFEEAVNSGIKKIIFVVKPGDKKILNYFKKDLRLEKILKKRKKHEILNSLETLENLSKKIFFSFVYQKEPLGDGHAVLQAKNLVKKEPCLVLFGDDIVEAKIPCSLQLIKIFNKYQKPVIALCKLPKKKLSSYGTVKVEKVGSRLYKIKGIVEKPSTARMAMMGGKKDPSSLTSQAPSNLAIVGKYIIDSDVFNFLKNTPSQAKGEIKLAGAFNEMIKKGMTVYGYEFKGKWLECGNKLAYLKSNLYLSLKHSQFGEELRKFLKKPRW